jgi:hypothetical protein
MRIETIDLKFLGAKEIIASFLLLGDSSAALVHARRGGRRSPTTSEGKATPRCSQRALRPGRRLLQPRDGLMRYGAKRRDRAPD